MPIAGDSETDSLRTSIEITSSAIETSCGTLGVHDVIYSEKHWGKKMIPRTGAYQRLKVEPETSSLIPLYERALKSYNIDDEHFQEFIRFCQTTCDHENPINPYPIMHQMYHGRFIVKNQNYAWVHWPDLVEKALNLGKSDKLAADTRIFYLEECDIDDEVLSTVIKVLNQAPRLQEIYLVNLKVGPQTTAALAKLVMNRGLKANQPNVSIYLRRCELRLTDFED